MVLTTTLKIVESRPYVLSLSAADRTALQELVKVANSRGGELLSCSFGFDHQCTIFVRDVVGVIQLADLRLVIEPKIGSKHFSFLASLAMGTNKDFGRDAELNDEDEFIEILVAWFLSNAEQASRDGFPVSFVEQQHAGTFLRGRLRTKETVASWSRGRFLVHSDVDELVTDIAINRIIKATCKWIFSGGVIQNSSLRLRARSLLRILHEVGNLEDSDLRYTPRLQTKRRAADAALLGKRILSGQFLSLQTGDLKVPSFLISTPLLIEEALRFLVLRAIPDSEAVRGRLSLNEGENFITLNPDLVLGGGVAVGDIKYKLFDSYFNRDDLAQSVLYATGYRTKNSLVLAFSRQRIGSSRQISVGDVTISLITWDTSNPSPLLESFRFSESVKTWWSGI